MTFEDAFDSNLSDFKQGIKFPQFENAIFRKITDHYCLIELFGFKAMRKPKVKGWTGHLWRPDIALQKNGKIVAVFECKNTGKESNPMTFRNNMVRAFGELSDIYHALDNVKCFAVFKHLSGGARADDFRDLFTALNGDLIDGVRLMNTKDIDKEFFHIGL